MPVDGYRVTTWKASEAHEHKCLAMPPRQSGNPHSAGFPACPLGPRNLRSTQDNPNQTNSERGLTMLQLTVNGSWTQFMRPLRNHEAFKTYGNLHGHPGPAQSHGLLSRFPELRKTTALADYVVYSYETPIAWHVPGSHWIMPDIRYSVTTSKAQGRIGTAISVLKNEYCSFCGCSYSG